MASDPAERWHLRLLPLMRAALVLMAIFFFGASLFQYMQVYRDVNQQLVSSFKEIPTLEKRLDSDNQRIAAAARFHTMVALEQDAQMLRYRHLNAVLLLRTWTRYTGFLVGMVLAMTGAFFILGRLREDATHIAAEGGGAKLDLATQSPGIVLVVLGTALMVVTIWVRYDVNLNDRPVYLMPWGLERAVAEQAPKEISTTAKDLAPSSNIGFPPRPPTTAPTTSSHP